MTGAPHWTDDLERDGRRDRQWCGVSKGRDFGAWLGLVPRQISTAGRTILSKVSKQGNRYLRVVFVQAAWVVLINPKTWERRQGLKQWIIATKKRLHHNVLGIALANKLAGIAWAVLNKDRDFECEKTEMAPRCAWVLAPCARVRQGVAGSTQVRQAKQRWPALTTHEGGPSFGGCGAQVLRRSPATLETLIAGRLSRTRAPCTTDVRIPYRYPQSATLRRCRGSPRGRSGGGGNRSRWLQHDHIPCAFRTLRHDPWR
jgi:hypothetical protein